MDKEMFDAVYKGTTTLNLFCALNDDVLYYLLPFLSSRDAFRLMLTCHYGYAYAVPRFVSEIVLGSNLGNGPGQIASFCAFMKAHGTHAITQLRTLTIMDTAFLRADGARTGGFAMIDHDYSCAERLAQVLSGAVNLAHIRIMQPDPLFRAQPSLVDALCALPRLDEISLVNGGSASLQFLSRLASHPQEVSLHMARQPLLLKDEHPEDLTALLPLSDCLHTLHLWSSFDLTKRLTPETVWPSVGELSLGGAIALERLLPAFPNVRKLYFGDCQFSPGSAELDDWREIDSVTAVCFVPLAFQVRRLALRYNIALDARTATLLEKAAPVVLECFVGWGALDPRIATAVPHLKFLQLHVKWSDPAAHTLCDGPQAWLMTYVCPFAQVSLFGLSIHVCVGAVDAARMDVARLAEAIARTIPSLQYVAVAIDGTCRGACADDNPVYRWYRCTAGAGHPELQEIADWHAEEVYAQLTNVSRL